MKTTHLLSAGRGACPQAPTRKIRAVGGNSPYRFALLLPLFLVTCALAAPTVPSAKQDGCACCREKADTEKKPAPCCAGKDSVPAEIVNRKSETENPAATPAYTKESLYQLDGRFTDDSGRPFALGALRGKPVVIDLFFASCGYACPLTVTDLLAIQGRLPPAVRHEAVFVLVSFDPVRDTPAALAQYRRQRGLDGRWILLHGADGDVRELAALLGVKYRQEADGSFSHSNLVTVLNREGEIAHQRIGLQGGLDETTAALVRVSGGPAS